MKYLLSFSLLLITFTVYAESKFSGKMILLGTYNDEESWLNGGLGRFGTGSDSDNNKDLSANLQLGYRYSLNNNWSFFTHVQGRHVSDKQRSRRAGFVELYIKYSTLFNRGDQFTWKIGQFFLPTSMENIEQFWDTPYTITFSALNSWIGEEFRPIGVDFDFSKLLQSGAEWTIAATLFGGNDASGAVIAWRGWSHGRHRSVYGEKLPLPDLLSLADGGSFAPQDDNGSKSFQDDLDGRIGYALRHFWNIRNVQIKLTWVDNQGDAELHRDDYAWRTKFGIAGFKWKVTNQLELLGEYISGSTTMGEAPTTVDVDFRSAYLLASYTDRQWRYSVRYDRSIIRDREATVDNINSDRGNSYTVAIFHFPKKNWRIGAEVLYTRNDRQRLLRGGGVFNDDSEMQFSLLTDISF